MAKLMLDHIIVPVNDIDETVSFWTEYLEVVNEGEQEPFTILRINQDLVFNLAPWGTDGGAHYAFSLDGGKFQTLFLKLKSRNIPYGEHFHTVGSQLGPGEEPGARGIGKTIYFFDPNQHLLEIRTYDEN